LEKVLEFSSSLTVGKTFLQTNLGCTAVEFEAIVLVSTVAGYFPSFMSKAMAHYIIIFIYKKD
jgi:hypothetical protein